MVKKIILGLAALFLTVGLIWYNATEVNVRQLQAREEVIKSEKIDEDTSGLLVAFFSDLAYGTFVDVPFVEMTVGRINAFQPDVIVFGGDLFDVMTVNQLDDDQLSQLSMALSQLQARYGKYAVYGDVDIFAREKADRVYAEAGFTILDNTSQLISIDRNSMINLIGIGPSVSGTADPDSSFAGINHDLYTLVISHCPDLFGDLSEQEFDYMLSGHSRGGQIYLPVISFFTRDEGCSRYFKGKITRNGKTVDITNGVGRIHYDARLLADAEIVLYRLDKPYSVVEDYNK